MNVDTGKRGSHPQTPEGSHHEFVKRSPRPTSKEAKGQGRQRTLPAKRRRSGRIGMRDVDLVTGPEFETVSPCTRVCLCVCVSTYTWELRSHKDPVGRTTRTNEAPFLPRLTRRPRSACVPYDVVWFGHETPGLMHPEPRSCSLKSRTKLGRTLKTVSFMK